MMNLPRKTIASHDLDGPSADYFRTRTRQLRAQGLDPDDDDAWAQPDNEPTDDLDLWSMF